MSNGQDPRDDPAAVLALIKGARIFGPDMVAHPDADEDAFVAQVNEERAHRRAQYEAREAAKKAAGRYTLEEAATMLAAGAGEREEVMLAKLRAAAQSGALPTYEPGRNARIAYGASEGQLSRVRSFYEEVFWDDLNRWLETREPRLTYRFLPLINRPQGAASIEPETPENTVDALRWWFRLDTWTLREGFLLLAGIDPHHSEDVQFGPDGVTFAGPEGGALAGLLKAPATYCRIGTPPHAEVGPDGLPRVMGPLCLQDAGAIADFVRLSELLNLWDSVPAHEGLTRATPSHFIEWAERKGLAPFWLEAARGAGLLAAPLQETPVTQAAPVPGTVAPIPRPMLQQAYQEAEILRVLCDLGNNPKALPRNVPGKPGVKAAARGRLSFSTSVFDKAWDRLRAAGEIADA